MMTPPRTPTTAAGRALLTMNTPGPDAGQVSDFHSGYCDGLTGHECSCDLPFAILAIEAEAAAAERSRIYGHLVDRLWGCDADANAVLNIVEEPTP